MSSSTSNNTGSGSGYGSDAGICSETNDGSNDGSNDDSFSYAEIYFRFGKISIDSAIEHDNEKKYNLAIQEYQSGITDLLHAGKEPDNYFSNQQKIILKKQINLYLDRLEVLNHFIEKL